jgi:cobalt-zinc-cadmium efflux system membrane fusion protein
MKIAVSHVSVFALIAAAFCTVACQSKAGETSTVPEAAKPEAKVEPTETVELDAGMLANIKIQPVREAAMHALLTATGKVQFNEDRTARVLAPLAGQIRDLSLRVGDPVQKDQVLFNIKSREVGALVTDYIESQRDQDLAQKTYNMTKDLFEHQAASRISLQQSESELAKAKAHVLRAEEALHVLGLEPQEAEKDGGVRSVVPVRSTLAGTVIERTVTPGQFVQADSTALLTIADLSSVWVMVDVFERDLHLVHPGQKVRVVAVAYPERHFNATVERISDKVDPDSRTLKVRLLVSNPNLLLKPEMFITAALELSGTSAGISIPAKAMFTEGEKSFVFVATGDKRFERRQLAAIPEGDGQLRVTNGVRTGDRVVTDGVMLLRLRQTQSRE